MTTILKHSVVFSYAQRRKQTVYYLYINIWLFTDHESVLINFTVCITKQPPVNISFLKN